MDNKDTVLIVILIILFLMYSTWIIFEGKKNNFEVPTYIEKDTIPNDYLGEYKITFYCDCPICTGTVKGSKTYSGHKPKEGRTIACDGEIIKLHQIVYIEDLGFYICEDKGLLAKKQIDVFVHDHEKAKQMGIMKKKVYLLE